MSISREDEEKILNLKEKLLLVYKAAASDSQKRRVLKNINTIDKVIKDIEDGKDVDLTKLNIFSNEKQEKPEIVEDDGRINYLAKVESIKMSEDHNDAELNEIYSFYRYFEDNFLVPLQDNYFKIDYQYSKRRDLIFAHHDALNHLFEEYLNDFEVLKDLKIKEQVATYKNRVDQQKAYTLIKLGEFLFELKELLDDIIKDRNAGMNTFYNPDEKFYSKFAKDNNYFEGCKMIEIINELMLFMDDFIEIIRMPDFKKRKK